MIVQLPGADLVRLMSQLSEEDRFGDSHFDRNLRGPAAGPDMLEEKPCQCSCEKAGKLPDLG